MRKRVAIGTKCLNVAKIQKNYAPNLTAGPFRLRICLGLLSQKLHQKLSLGRSNKHSDTWRNFSLSISRAFENRFDSVRFVVIAVSAGKREGGREKGE